MIQLHSKATAQHWQKTSGYFFYLLWMILYISPVNGQAPGNVSYKFSHLDINSGLASNHVSAILQDHKGFIWIASTALQRYDGTNLVTVANFDRVPGSIYYDDICLCEDKKGRIWMGTPDNIRVYDPVTALVKSLRVDGRPALPEGLQCSQIVQDRDGVIWATTHDGLLRFDDKEFNFKKAAIIPEADRRQMEDAIMEDESGNLWISGKKGLYILDRERKHLYSTANNPEQLPVLNINNSFKKIFTDYQHRIWLAGRLGQLYCYDTALHKLNTYTFDAPSDKRVRSPGAWDAIFDVTADGEKSIWVATEKGGIFRYNNQTSSFDLNITADNTDEQGFHFNYEANCFLSDREGHLWIGTDHGVNILSLHNKSFRRLDHRTTFPNTKEQLPATEVTGIYQATNGNVYVGYWGRGFSRLTSQLELLRNYVHNEGDPNVTLPEERGLVWSFAELKDGTILVGQENGNLSLFNPATGKFSKHLSSPALCEQTLLHLQPQNDTTVWIGLYKRGLASWNPQQNTFQHFHELTDSLKRPISVMDIVPQNDSLLWLGASSGGLIRFNAHTRKITARASFAWKTHLYNNITCLLKYNDSILLAGTDHGLWIYNVLNNTYEPLKINNQLFDEWVLSMEEDVPGKIWFTTQYGFYRYNLPADTLETFVQGDDIIDNTRKVRRRIVTLQDGRLLVGGSEHFVSFDPASLLVAPPPPDVTIVSLKALDSTILIEAALRDSVPVTLTYKQNFIGIEFKSLQYHHEKIRYYYQLEGVDENWVGAEDILVAKYTNLPPGNYIFRVRAVSTAGTYSDHISTLQLYIKPAFWQTGWFRLLCLLLAVSLAYLYFKLRIDGIKKEAKQREAIQQQIAQLEMKALRAQMNPHFIFNALNSIQTFMMKSETEQALVYLSRFAKLIRNVLDNSQLNNISVAREVNVLENYMELEKLRFADEFEYNIIIDPLLDTEMVEIPTMIIQPFVENAIWHGLLHEKTKGKLTITFRLVNDRVLCTIEDNGIGREKSAAMKRMNKPLHQSRGLQITRDRLSLYNSRFNVDASFDIEDLVDEDGRGIGTRVNLWFPLVEE
ncbi:two component regulator with propeller domain [Chitinophaga niastensis]|uniref:Two component regulator with propeller domain n=1 Tax=Chitinophaga niastensis TaxID=536980 RepID=A0A2P8HR87_CHINA|nr:sensor histidine kinase [Chitinophaga niastensis]PSL48704.1 two component regulator with propeller domain [Chitinophaga niastensis]